MAEKKKDLSCVNCKHCDMRNVGYCENEDVVKKLDSWTGVILFPDKHYCCSWESKGE